MRHKSGGLAFIVKAVSTIALGVACGGKCIGELPQDQSEGRRPARELKFENWRIQLDLSRQVLGIDIPDDRSFREAEGNRAAPIQPTLQGMGGGFLSASVLAQKAKQFDDGLYAAVDLAAQSGAGRFAGKKSLLEALTRALAQRDVGSGSGPLEVIYAAARLGNLDATPPQALRGTMERRLQS